MQFKIPQNILQKLSIRAVELINEQIQRGIDAEGKPYRYSTKPFARPIGGIPRFGQFSKNAQKEGRLKIFSTKKNSKWALFTRGYADYRSLTGRNPAGDFLEFSGEMLASMTGFARHPNQAVVGFSSQKAAERAFWFNVSGVGRSRKLWKFLGLTPENEKILVDYAADLLAKTVELQKNAIGLFEIKK
jgi:phage gpG-like protein